MKRIAAPFLVVAFLVGSAAPLIAADEKKAGTQDKKKEAQPAKKAEPHVSPIYQAAEKAGKGKPIDESVVITNAELEKMWAGLSPTEKLEGVYQAERHIGAPTAGDAGAGAPGEAAPADKGAQPASPAAQQNIGELRTKVDELERRLLALRNPLLPRRYAERKDEKNENWDKMNNSERIAATEDELKKAKEDLAAAERGASGSGSSSPAPTPAKPGPSK
jgi:hypothetical protein